jgi:hypothetical protein
MPYSKRRSDQTVWTFKVAPPQTRLDVKTLNQYGPKFPPGLTRFTSTVYYYWWQFLRLNPLYQTCCDRIERQDSVDDLPRYIPEIYRDFGWLPQPVVDPEKITQEDTEGLFSEWWRERGWVLFVEPKQTGRVVSGTTLPDTHDPNTCLALSVPLDIDISSVAQMIQYQLRQAQHHYEQNNPTNSWAIYRPKKYKIDALEKYLHVKRSQLHFQKQNDRIPTMSELRYAASDDSALALYKKDKIAAEARRKSIEEDLSAADAIIYHVGFGVFPFTKRRGEYLQNPEDHLPTRAAYMRHELSELKRLGWVDKKQSLLADWRK